MRCDAMPRHATIATLRVPLATRRLEACQHWGGSTMQRRGSGVWANAAGRPGPPERREQDGRDGAAGSPTRLMRAHRDARHAKRRISSARWKHF